MVAVEYAKNYFLGQISMLVFEVQALEYNCIYVIVTYVEVLGVLVMKDHNIHGVVTLISLRKHPCST